jgi:hypothetical protein
MAVQARESDLGGVAFLKFADPVGREGQVPGFEIGQNFGPFHNCQEKRQKKA